MQGFSQKVATVLNPLPATTWQELFLKVRSIAGLGERELFIEDIPNSNSKALPFSHSWTYAGGPEERAETLTLGPGERFGLRESEIKVFQGTGSNKERGMVVIQNPKNPNEVLQKSIDGLQQAVSFYRIRGRHSLNDVRKRTEVTEDQIKASIHFYLAYFINEAKYQIVLDHIGALKEKRAAAQAASAQ